MRGGGLLILAPAAAADISLLLVGAPRRELRRVALAVGVKAQDMPITNFPYLAYVSLAGNVGIVVTSLAAIANISRLLYFNAYRPARLKVKNVQPALLFYLIAHLLCLTAWLPHHCYMVLWWSVGRWD
jgi:hypothetical protein